MMIYIFHSNRVVTAAEMVLGTNIPDGLYRHSQGIRDDLLWKARC